MRAAEQCFVRAVQCDPHNTILQENMDYFLRKKYPDNPEISCYDVIRREATGEMLRDIEVEELRKERMRADPAMQDAVMKVQMSWRRHCFFREIMGREAYKKQQARARQSLEEGPGDESSSDDETSDDESSVDSEAERLRGKRARRWEEGADITGRKYRGGVEFSRLGRPVSDGLSAASPRSSVSDDPSRRIIRVVAAASP